MKKTIICTLIISLLLVPLLFVQASDLYSDMEYSGFVGDEITIYYSPSSESCLADDNSSARVSVGGRTATVDNWYKCSGNIIIEITNSLQSGKITVYDNAGGVQDAGYLTVHQNPHIYSVTPKYIIPGETRITIKGRDFGDTFYDNTLYVSGEGYSYLSGSSDKIEIEKASWSDNEISFDAPSAIKAGKIYLREFKSYGSYTDFFESPYYYLQPKIRNYDFDFGKVGDNIYIFGNNFKYNFAADKQITYGVRAYFGGIQGSVSTWEEEKIVAEIPFGAKSGPIKIELFCNDIPASVSDEGKEFTVLTGTANDEFSAYQKYLNQINIKSAWNYTTGSKEIVVAVIDDGVYINHPELQDNIWQNEKEVIGNNKDDDNNGYIDDRLGWDFVSDVSEMTTRGTHGTMVAGIIGAVGNNNQGITGINWKIKIMSLIACDKVTGCDEDAIEKAIRYAADNGADIINLSLSSWMTIGYTDKLDDAIKYAYDKNILLVAAAGNGDVEGGIGQNLDIIPQSPVCNDGGSNMILGVGAVTEDGYRTSWSNYGKCVDIYAPGEEIMSTAVPAYSTFKSFYDYGNGTSFSAPIVSGVAALIKSKYPNISNKAIANRIMYNTTGGVIDASKLFSPLQESEKIDIKKVFVDTEKELTTNIDKSLSKRLSGKILLQVEESGAGWYVNPNDEKKYYLGRPVDAFEIMRKLGLGISESNYNSFNGYAPWNLSGKILLRVEASGEAYYVNPGDRKMHYLGRPEDAFKVMRDLGLGITNNDIRKIEVGEL